MEMTDIDTAIESSLPTTEETPPPAGDEGAAGEQGEQGKGKPKEQDPVEEGGEVQKPAEGAAGDDEGGEPPAEGNEPPQKPHRNRFQERIDQKTRENYELRREIDEMRTQLDSKPPELPPKPDPANYTFRNDEERLQAQRQYDYDLGQWNAQCKAINDQHANRDAVRIQQEQQRYFSKMSGEQSIYGDYNTALRTLGSYQMTPELHTALMADENNTDLFCFLGNPKNFAIAEDVFRLKGYAQSRKLAEISFKLQAAKSRQKAKPTNAPPPVSKPKGGAPSGGAKNLGDMNDADYRKAMKKAKEKLNKF